MGDQPNLPNIHIQIYIYYISLLKIQNNVTALFISLHEKDKTTWNRKYLYGIETKFQI